MKIEPSLKIEDYVGEIEKVTEPALIVNFLQRIHSSRALLTVTVPGHNELYNSAILEVNARKGYILLDEINPKEGHVLFLKAAKLQAQTRLKGVDLSFDAALQKADGKEGIAFYKVAMPSLVYYRQRRACYRVRIGAGLAVPVQMSSENHMLQGILYDISAGGIGARFNPRLSLEFEHGKIIPHCTIDLPTGNKISSGLEVRFLLADEQHKHLHLGGRFVDLDKAQEKAVERFVADIDRQLRKKMIKD